jgi:hypothetical protein
MRTMCVPNQDSRVVTRMSPDSGNRANSASGGQ